MIPEIPHPHLARVIKFTGPLECGVLDQEISMKQMGAFFKNGQDVHSAKCIKVAFNGESK